MNDFILPPTRSVDHTVIFFMSFKCTLRASSASNAGVNMIQSGGKVILPPSIMHTLLVNGIRTPFIFRLCKLKNLIQCEIKDMNPIHMGVLEFTAHEGEILLPDWLMGSLSIKEEDLVSVESVSLPVGKYVKILPLEPTFLSLTNPRAVLEHNFSRFSALTKGSTIGILHNACLYHIKIIDISPQNQSFTGCDAISIIDVDIQLELDESECSKDTVVSETFSELRYRTPGVKGERSALTDSRGSEESSFEPFSGGARCLSGKIRPTYEADFSQIERSQNSNEAFRPFSTKGRSLRE